MSLNDYPHVRDWLRVENGKLVLRTGKVDLGQRISTALVRIACEELDIAPQQIGVAPVRTDDSPDEGITSGSNSIEHSGHAQRMACATARDFALNAAADALGVAAAALEVSEGQVTHRGSNQKLDILTLLADLPDTLEVDLGVRPRALPEPLADIAPLGLRQMVDGSFVYLHDVERPGMLHARIVRPPMGWARLEAVEDAAVDRCTEADLTVVRDGSFLAVAGASEWAVVRAADRLRNACTWDIGDGLEAGDIFDIMDARTPHRLAVIDGKPDVAAPVAAPLPGPDYDAQTERPYTMHGALAPSAALAEWSGETLSILSHSQGIYFLRDSIADSLGLAPSCVTVEHVPGSGCYGHNGADDAAFDAALVARAVPGKPVLLKYSREDEHGREPLCTAMVVRAQARLADDGSIAEVWMEARGDTHRGRPRKGPNRAGPARLAANSLRDCDVPRFVPEPNMNRHAGLHRNLDPVYAVPKTRLVKGLIHDLPMRPSALRCLGAPANILAIESMMDALAQNAGTDPIGYRRRHLDDPRALAVLDRLAQMIEALPDPGEGTGRGVAYAQYKNAMTRVGLAVDLHVDDEGTARLDRVCLVADAGRVVDPDGLRAQLEGGILQGASWALHERVTWEPEGRTSLDWDSYPVLRFDDVPLIDIEILQTPDTPSVGAGEASPGPTVAAIANAIFAATGLRLQRMPFNRDAIIAAALQS